MAKYKCKCRVIEVYKSSMKIVDGKIVTPEAYCNKCNTYGEYIKEHEGFGGIIKGPQGTVSKKF